MGASLAGPFIVLGLVGGWLTGTLTHDGDLVAVFSLVTALMSGLLGLGLTRRERTRGRVSKTAIAIGTVCAGMINGTLLMIPTAFPLGSMAGAVAGALFSLPFIPAFVLVHRFGAEIGFARVGSLVDKACRRGRLAATAVSVSVASAVFHFGHACRAQVVDCLADRYGGLQPKELVLVHMAVGLMTMVLAAVVVCDLVAWRAAKRFAKRLATDALLLPPSSIDFGIGDDVMREGEERGVPYRAPEAKVRLCRGDPRQALDPLRKALSRDSIALFVGLLALAAHVVR